MRLTARHARLQSDEEHRPMPRTQPTDQPIAADALRVVVSKGPNVLNLRLCSVSLTDPSDRSQPPTMREPLRRLRWYSLKEFQDLEECQSRANPLILVFLLRKTCVM